MGAEGNGDEGQQPAAPVKFSFSNGKTSNRRPPRPQKDKGKSHADPVEYVIAFDEERGIVSTSPRLDSGARIVPKLENSWRPEKRMKNIMTESDVTASTEETFELEETIAAGPKANVQYGLTLMSRVRISETISEGAIAQPAKKTSFQEMEDKKLREDLMVLPEEAALERYEELPVEEFGEALLRGMGWEKGKPIGRNAKIAIEPIEYVRRQWRSGLGAVPAPPKETNRKYIKPGQTRERQPDLVAPPRADGRSRNVVDPDTKLVERVRKGCAKGKFMSVISGRHAGLRGEVISIDDSEGDLGVQVVLKLVKSGEKVVLRSCELADVGSVEEESAMKKMGELRIGNGKAGRRDERRSAEGDDSRERIRSNRSEDLREDRRGDDRGNRSSRKNHPNEFADRRERSNRDLNEREGRGGKRDGQRDDDIREADDREGRRGRRDSDRDVDEGHVRKRDGSSSGRRDKSSRKREVADEMDVDDEYERKRSRRREERQDGRREEDRSKNLAYERPLEFEKGQDFGEKDHSGEQNGKDSMKIVRSQISREVVTATTSGSVKIQSETVRTTSQLVDNRSRAYSEGEQPSESWLRSHIRVRFISKSYHGGRLYLKKGRVIDVISPKVCDILLDESSEMLQDVRQEYLETALPKKGGRIMVVGGKHRGQIGKLLERDSENEVGIVQLEDSFEMVKFALEDLAELVGDPSGDDD